jgi:hypothetical protein
MTGHVEAADLAAGLTVPPSTVEAMAEAASFVFVARPDGTRGLALADAARIVRAIRPADPRWGRGGNLRVRRPFFRDIHAATIGPKQLLPLFRSG